MPSRHSFGLKQRLRFARARVSCVACKLKLLLLAEVHPMQDGGDGFQGASAAAALEALALVLALAFPVHRRRARFRALDSAGKVGTGL